MTNRQSKRGPYEIRELCEEEALLTALKMRNEARERARRSDDHLKRHDSAGAIQEAAESIERSVKGMVALVLHEFPITHRLTGQHNIRCLKELQSRLPGPDTYYLFKQCARTLAWAHIWSPAREINQWAFDEVPITTAELFELSEARVASDHARRCVSTLNQLIHQLETQGSE